MKPHNGFWMAFDKHRQMHTKDCHNKVNERLRESSREKYRQKLSLQTFAPNCSRYFFAMKTQKSTGSTPTSHSQYPVTVQTCFRKYATFSGTASKAEFWWWAHCST